MAEKKKSVDKINISRDAQNSGDAALVRDMDEKEMQKLYMEYQLLEERSSTLQKELQKIAEQMYEIEHIKNSISEFESTEKGNEMLSPISSGVFVKSKIEDTKTFYVNVGSGIVVKKTPDDVKKLMDEQALELANVQAKIARSMDAINKKLMQIESVIISAQEK